MVSPATYDPVAARAGLKQFLERHNLTPTDLARICSWRHPTKIYNFLNGKSSSLSFPTIQRIIEKFRDTSIDELRGLGRSSETIPTVALKTSCEANKLRERFTLPDREIRQLPFPLDDDLQKIGLFAAVVRRPGAENLYHENSILVIQAMSRFDRELTQGRRVLVQRLVGMRIEVTVREVRAANDGRLWLSHGSNDPILQTAVILPKNVSEKIFQYAGERYMIVGVVVYAWVQE